MCIGGSPKAPAAPAALPEAPQTPEVPLTASGTAAGSDDERRRRAAAGGTGQSTILTGARGITDGAATQAKTLLGE